MARCDQQAEHQEQGHLADPLQRLVEVQDIVERASKPVSNNDADNVGGKETAAAEQSDSRVDHEGPGQGHGGIGPVRKGHPVDHECQRTATRDAPNEADRYLGTKKHEKSADFRGRVGHAAIDHRGERDGEEYGHRIIEPGFQHQRVLHANAQATLALLDQQKGGGGICRGHGRTEEQADERRHAQNVGGEQAHDQRRHEHAECCHQD